MDPFHVSIVVGAFLLGGAVKGIVGLGVPTVALAVLGTALGLREALLLLVAPAFLTNVWQAAAGGHFTTLPRYSTSTIIDWLRALGGRALTRWAAAGSGRWACVSPGMLH